MNRRLIIFILIIVLIGGWAGWHFTRKKPNLSLVVAPSVAKIVIDGNKTVKQGNLYMLPGHHKLVASMDGFASRSLDFDVVANKLITETIVLVPNSQVGVDWLINHQSEELRREGLGGAKFDSTVSSAVKTLPVIKELPFIDQLYRIDYGKSKAHPDDPNAIAIYITYYSDAGKQQALDWLKFKGYDPSKLELIYEQGTAP